MPKQARPVLGRFWENVDKGNPDECWEWLGYARKGYGRMTVDGHLIGAHRISWILYHGKLIPEGMIIRHLCGNSLCVNPHHLAIGTHSENAIDRSRNGRKSKLSHKQVLKILALYRNQNLTQQEIATIYGISQTQISRILGGHQWGWLTGIKKENNLSLYPQGVRFDISEQLC